MKSLHRKMLKIVLAVFVVLAAAPHVHAEKRIGVIMTGDIPYYGAIHETFVKEINRLSGETEKIEIILQRPFPNPLSWSNAARKLIAFDVDLIVTYGSPATQAVIEEKSSIPQVYVGLYEPENLVLNTKNATGCGYKVPLTSILRYFRHLSTFNSLGILYNSFEEDSVRQLETMQALGLQQDILIKGMDIKSRTDLDKLGEINANAVFITGSSLVHIWLDDIIEILDKQRIPTADIFPDDNESGVLMTLYQPSIYQGEMAAEMAWQILRGKKPAAVSQHIFRDTELVLNLVEARHIGINFPIQLLIEATKVIE